MTRVHCFYILDDEKKKKNDDDDLRYHGKILGEMKAKEAPPLDCLVVHSTNYYSKRMIPDEAVLLVREPPPVDRRCLAWPHVLYILA